jgi:hypothetical protein
MLETSLAKEWIFILELNLDLYICNQYVTYLMFLIVDIGYLYYDSLYFVIPSFTSISLNRIHFYDHTKTCNMYLFYVYGDIKTLG